MDSDGNQTQTKRYQCDTCGKQFDIYSTFYSHRKTHTPSIVSCKLCNMTFKRKQSMFKHFYDDHGKCTPSNLQPIPNNLIRKQSTLSSRLFDDV
jgi:predicted nucleic acid-binding Zn ribbon protein